jgi:hypothetical protein
MQWVDGVAPVSYVLYPTVTRTRRVLRKVLLGGAATLALAGALTAGYLLRGTWAQAAAFPAPTAMNAAADSLVAGALAEPIVTHRPPLGPPGEPAAKDVVPAPGQVGHDGEPGEPAAKAAPRAARRAAVTRAKPRAASPAATPAAAGKREISDAELQKILDGT